MVALVIRDNLINLVSHLLVFTQVVWIVYAVVIADKTVANSIHLTTLLVIVIDEALAVFFIEESDWWVEHHQRVQLVTDLRIRVIRGTFLKVRVRALAQRWLDHYVSIRENFREILS